MQFYNCHLQMSSLASIASKCPSQHFKTFAFSFDGWFTGTMLYSSSALLVLKLCLSFLLLRQQLVLNQMQPHCFFLTNPHSIYHVSSESAEKESVVNNVSNSPLMHFNPIAIQLFSSHKPFCELFFNPLVNHIT